MFAVCFHLYIHTNILFLYILTALQLQNNLQIQYHSSNTDENLNDDDFWASTKTGMYQTIEQLIGTGKTGKAHQTKAELSTKSYRYCCRQYWRIRVRSTTRFNSYCEPGPVRVDRQYPCPARGLCTCSTVTVL